jgi:hypothetical protein
MAISFTDQVTAFLAASGNQSGFPAFVGLAAFATASFTQRYSSGGFQLNSVTLGGPTNFRFQQMFNGDLRLTGARERRSEQPPREVYNMRVELGAPSWVDAIFTVPAQMAIQPTPGAIQLGPAGGLTQTGVGDPGRTQHALAFKLAVATDVVNTTYQTQCFVFATSDPAPVQDLRRIAAVRRIVDQSDSGLVSLDGSPDQSPNLFVQLYPTGVLAATPLSQNAVVAAFGAADVLAAFVNIPNM